MTQITRKSVPMRGLVFLLAMFLGAGLVLSGCGDDDTATTPAPAPPPPPPPAPEPEPEPEPPAPEAPATPTGLHVDETTETSVEYHWNAVEGANAYVVQVSMDEMFGDEDDATDITLETHYTVTGLEPDTSVYLRVAAAVGTSVEDAILSPFTTHVTGMSNQPPPEPEPTPDPVSATFMVPEDADSAYPMVPDDGTDEATAMASVNSQLTVTSNTTAVITPTWDADAAGVSVIAGDNMPFTYVDWKAMQSAVVDGGATFMIQRTTMGANQEPESTGDIAYVTCGPFACVEGEDAPAISISNSSACEGWDPMLELTAGVVDPNGTTDANADDTADDSINSGIDLGWVYTANTAFTVKHDFATFSASGGEHGKGTDAALGAGRPPLTGTKARRNITTNDFVVIDVDATDGAASAVVAGCDSANAGSDLYGHPAGTLDEPRNCFRLAANANADYLGQYSVEMTPKDAGVAWGEIAWEAFADLECEMTAFAAADQIDVCELLQTEVDGFGAKTIALPVVDADANGAQDITQATDGAVTGGNQGKLMGFNLSIPIDQTRWTALKYLDTTTTAPKDTDDLYDATAVDADANTTGSPINVKGRLNGGNGVNVWVKIHDADGDPMYGDLGKVDGANIVESAANGRGNTDRTVAPTADQGPYGGNDVADNYGSDDADTQTAANSDASKCTADDGGEADTTTTQGTGTAARALSNGDGTLCDSAIDIETSVTFVDGMGFGCAVPVSYTLSCEWDASGGRGAGSITVDNRASQLTQANVGQFLKCTVS